MKPRNKPKDVASPTPEQMARGNFQLGEIRDVGPRASVTIGKAWRRVPMIYLLWLAKVIDHAEYKALYHYRHHADLADKSPIRDSLNIHRGGGGNGIAFTTLNTCRVRDDCERAAGALADILRRVVVDDWSLAQWAIHRGGGIERPRKRGTHIEAHPDYLILAKYEIRFAAQRVQSELDSEPLDRRIAA